MDDTDWDTEEFQAALKTVLKYEIQSLLERLSHTGEETVLLTVNTVDMHVGHLASSNAEKFVNSLDIGQIKAKFLQYLTGQPHNAQGTQKPVIKSEQDSGAYSSSEKSTLGQWSSTTVSKQSVKRSHDNSIPSQETQNILKRRKIEENIQGHPQFRKNMPVTSSGPTSVTVKSSGEISKPHTGHLDGDITHERLHDQAANKGKLDIKLNTTRIVSKSGGFTEERLSDTEFKNLLKLCNSDDEEDEDFDEESLNDGVVQLPEQLSFLLQGKPQQHQPFSNRNLNQQGQGARGISTKITHPNPSVIGVRSNPEMKLSAQPQNLKGKVEVKPELEKENYSKTGNIGGKLRNVSSAEFTKEDSGLVRRSTAQNVTVRESDSSKIKINPILNMPEIKEELDPHDTEYKQSDQIKLPAASSQDKSQGERWTDKKAVQEKENKLETPVKEGKPNSQNPAFQRQQRALSDDELDTETLIQMAKAKHKETLSDADKEIQAKLGQLSSKLSWVVEYPKKNNENWKQPQQEMPQANQPVGKPYPVQMQMEEDLDEEEEEEEDDYDDEDFEEELDEEDLAALRAIQANNVKKLMGEKMEGFQGEGNIPMEYRGNLRGMQGGEYDAEYGEDEMGHEQFDEYGYNPGEMEEMDEEEEDMEDRGMHGMGDYEHLQPDKMGSFQPEENQMRSQNTQYQRVSSPTMDNFLLMGPIMAKCLVCNKIIRKTEMKQHNEAHMEEEEEEEGNYEGEEEDWGEEGEEQAEQGVGDGEGYNVEDNFDQNREESEETEDYEGTSEQPVKFTAEKFVAEKVELTNKPVGKEKKSTVCDICNKQFKSAGNMQRHRKIHTDTSTFICPVCKKSFRLTTYLYSHLKKKHPDYKPDDDLENKDGDEKEKFADKDGLLEHVKIHGEKDW